MSCNHGGCNQDRHRACRGCLEATVASLRWRVTQAEDQMKQMQEAGGEAALKRLSQHKNVVSFLHWCSSVFGYAIRNPKTPEFDAYLKQQQARLKQFLEIERG